jgi:hypothetical protein
LAPGATLRIAQEGNAVNWMPGTAAVTGTAQQEAMRFYEREG